MTRFATNFTTLKSIYNHNHDLQALVIDQHSIMTLSKTAQGKAFNSIVLDWKFSDQVLVVIKVATSIIRLLTIVDSDEKPISWICL